MNEDERQVVSFIAGVTLGALVGAGVALLLAPHSGRRTRRHIVRAAEDLTESARDATEDARRAGREAVRRAERRGARLREAAGRRSRRHDS